MSHMFSGQFNNPRNPGLRSPCSEREQCWGSNSVPLNCYALASRSFHFPLLPVVEKTSESWNQPSNTGDRFLSLALWIFWPRIELSTCCRLGQSKFFLGSRVIRVGHMVQASPMSTKAWLPAEPSKGEDPLSEDEVAKVTLRL